MLVYSLHIISISDLFWLWCGHRSCHVFGRKMYSALFAMKSVWVEMRRRPGAGMFHCMCLLYGRCPSDLEIVLGFWRTTLWMNFCFVLFQLNPSFWVKFHADKLPSISLELAMAMRGSLCRGEEEKWWGFLLLQTVALCPHPWVPSACDYHRDGTRITAAYGLLYILLQDSWL